MVSQATKQRTKSGDQDSQLVEMRAELARKIAAYSASHRYAILRRFEPLTSSRLAGCNADRTACKRGLMAITVQSHLFGGDHDERIQTVCSAWQRS